ncbi:hypothetical protein L7F22_014827 [Adiantum nelumboides]|nr:hypothetical protein [Adiantum nelumboides]
MARKGFSHSSAVTKGEEQGRQPGKKLVFEALLQHKRRRGSSWMLLLLSKLDLFSNLRGRYGHGWQLQMADFVDRVSTVSASKVSKVLDDLKDEILSIDLGQGLVLEIDETLASEENNLQIVPWNIQEEVGASIDLEDEQKKFMHKGADILSTQDLISCFDCPPILLCRLIPYAKVRGLRDDVSGLKVAFGKEGYMQEKDDIKNKWDAIWKDINNEFEQELSKSVQLKDLSNHMFYVWGGNHKTVAWMEAIQDKFSNSKEKHCCIQCTIIDPTEVSKIALLTKNEFMLNIIDPSLGIDWHAKVLGLKWGADGWATLEKITMIATHDTPIQSGASNLEKEPIVDSIADDSLMPDIATPGTLLTRKSYTFVFLSEAPMPFTSLPCNTRCIALARDYIKIAADFRVERKNLVWSPIHEHMLKAKPDLVPYTRSGKSVAWAPKDTSRKEKYKRKK